MYYAIICTKSFSLYIRLSEPLTTTISSVNRVSAIFPNWNIYLETMFDALNVYVRYPSTLGTILE